MSYYIQQNGFPFSIDDELLKFDNCEEARNWAINHLFCDESQKTLIIELEGRE